MLQTWLTRPDGKQHGAYYTRVRYVSNDKAAAAPNQSP